MNWSIRLAGRKAMSYSFVSWLTAAFLFLPFPFLKKTFLKTMAKITSANTKQMLRHLTRNYTLLLGQPMIGDEFADGYWKCKMDLERYLQQENVFSMLPEEEEEAA
jgi:hypothetical protein